MNPNTFSRRAFLHSSLLAALQPVSGALSQSSTSGWIDAHVHVWSPDTKSFPLAAGSTKAEMQPPTFTPEELFAHSKPVGVDRIVLIQMSFYGTDNSYMLHAMEKHPGVFGGVAIVDEAQPDVVATMKALAVRGVRGFRIYASKAKAEAWSTSDGMKAMWSYAADADLAMCLLADPEALPAVLRMCKEYPKTKVVVDHFARIGVKGAMPEADIENLCHLADFKHTYVKTSAFYALGSKKPPHADLGPMIRRMRDAYGAQRLMWGSDCPYQVEAGHTYADSIALVRDHLDFLTTEDKECMLRKTAENLFFPGPH
ncbi:MAG: amidohydrolase family protein [Verrucomicrobia bacterium]|nr:amidohydrolase family protein [Verrucomicrobiota bacterium]